jgi:hypothetical protein
MRANGTTGDCGDRNDRDGRTISNRFGCANLGNVPTEAVENRIGLFPIWGMGNYPTRF